MGETGPGEIPYKTLLRLCLSPATVRTVFDYQQLRNRVSNTHAWALKLSEVLIDQLAKCSIALAVQKSIERAIEKIKETVATP
ncbi:hypothetical protein [Microcoleus sp. S13_D1]|uniref:hypothetical protein n=1 Tax=Microcoleus sp. S13_D1 TaxID=3055412 RepID=UPI002FD4B518